MKLLQLWVLLSGLFLSLHTTAQNYQPRPIPANYLAGYTVTDEERAAALASLTKPYDLTQALPKGYDTTGKTDYTDYLRKAIEQHEDIIMPNFPIKVSMKSSYGITMKSNTKILFQKNSKLIMEPDSKGEYAMLMLWNRKNITVYFANIEGDRVQHKGKGGERGMGISIAGSDNIRLIKPYITNCWGDGIYLGSYFTKTDTINACTNIYIEKAILDKNRRNGLSIVTAKNLVINGIIIANTYGTDPESGIDIEPGANYHLIEHITINNPISFNNRTVGIAINLTKLRWGNLKRTVGIEINNHIDDYSARGLHATLTDKDKTSTNSKNILSGYIRINNPVFYNQRYGKNLRIYDFQQNNNIKMQINWDARNKAIYQKSLADYNEQPQKPKNVHFSIN